MDGSARRPVDLVFANDAEVCSMFETDDFDAAARQIADMVEVAALTRSAEGRSCSRTASGSTFPPRPSSAWSMPRVP